MKTLILIFCITLFFTLSATIIHIPADQPTIQAGIDAAVDADTVLVQPGTYTENINYNGKNITVASLFLTTQDTTCISQTVIDGNQSGSVVTFESGEDSTAVLCGFTITNGYGDEDGGGICCRSSHPSLRNLTISDNSAFDNGGGIFLYFSSAKLVNVNLNNNNSHVGGGISCLNSNTNLLDVTINENDASQGGAFFCLNSNLFLTNVIIYDNYASHSGGGLYSSNSMNYVQNAIISENHTANDGAGIYCKNSELILEYSIIESNTSYSCGGGIYCKDSDLNLTNVQVINNAGELNGGGIYLTDSSTAFIFKSNLSGNEAWWSEGSGGAINCNDESYIEIENGYIQDNFANTGGGISCTELSELKIINTLISDNEGNDRGCAIHIENSNSTIVNSTINNNTPMNTACDGGGLHSSSSAETTLINCIFYNNLPDEIHFNSEQNPSSVTISYSDIQGGEAGIVTNNNGTVNWLEGNIDQDPLLLNSGEHPFSLTECSPCINAGIPDTTGLNLPEYDLAGNPRIFDDRIDMGAYEFQYEAFDADFEATPTTGSVPLTVQFTDLSSGGLNNLNEDRQRRNIKRRRSIREIISWEWDFDNDGTIDSNQQNPENVYDQVGVYTVSLTVSDGTYFDTETKTDYITVTDTGNENELIPLQTELIGNYPNPFNPVTTINYDLVQNTNVLLQVFNLKGQLIETLVNQHQDAGQYSVAWNAVNQSSGIYFYKLQAGAQTATGKCLLLK